MAVEFTAPAVQTVLGGQNVLFTDTPVRCNKGYVIHREGSGIATLRGIVKNNCCNQFARYLVSFSGNIAIATGGSTTAPISVAIALNGEALPSTTMTVNPGIVGSFFNVSKSTIIDVPKCCCQNVSIKNTTAANGPIDVTSADITIERLA